MTPELLLFGEIPEVIPPRELLAFAQESGISGNLRQAYLTARILSDENPWSLACEGRGDPGGSLSVLARRDMEQLMALFHRDDPDLVPELRRELLDYDRGERCGEPPAGALLCRLRDRLAAARSAEEFTACVAEAYKNHGVGIFAFHHAFRVGEGGALVPIRGMKRVSLASLVGYEAQKRLLTANTDAFLAGKTANNVLLYGDAGTGKSTCVRALLTEYADSPLRLVELQRSRFGSLPELLSALRGRNCRFILFIDDLSYEEHETEYKYLKAAIEGGLETMPDNVLIYATSNRRHLIRETWSDRSDMEHDDDVHRSDTLEEKLSLAERFGVTIRFDSPDRKLFHEIVASLAAERGVSLDTAALYARANEWELRHGGLSGRTAQQFVDDLAGCG